MSNRIEDGTHLVWLVKGKREGELGKTNICIIIFFKCEEFSEIV